MYTREVFERKKVKRALEKKNASIILQSNSKGCIVSLCGPAIEQHADILRPLLRKKSRLLFCEIDKSMAKNEKMLQRVEALDDQRIRLVIGDIWKTLKKQKGWDRKFILFDLDFCKTAYTLKNFEGLIPRLRWLANSKLPRQSGFFISLTVCKWGDLSNSYLDLSSDIFKIFDECGWSLVESRAKSYRESKAEGASMFNMLFHFKWNDGRSSR